MTLMKTVALVALLSPTAACIGDEDRGEEYLAPGEDEEIGKEDSMRSPTDHGEIPFGAAQVEMLSVEAGFHAWQFNLSGPAAINAFTTFAVRGQRRVDTVMYLYKKGPNGWGRYVARNDNDGNRVYSRIIRNLEAGTYRILVKGYAATIRGRFALTVDCSGDGCAATDARACRFGETYQDAFMAPGLVALNTTTLTAANIPELSLFDRQSIVAAAHQSSHTDVTTVEAALQRFDDREVNRTFFIDETGRRVFVAYEYGAGDNSYGAFFEQSSGALVAAINDGDLYRCTVAQQSCKLPETFQAFASHADYEMQPQRHVTNAAELSASEAAQFLASVSKRYETSFASVSAALAQIDRDSLRIVRGLYKPLSTDLTVIEYGAGDTSVGTIFYGESTAVAGVIGDGDIGACTLFAPFGDGRSAIGESCTATSDCGSGARCEGVFANSGRCVPTAVPPGEGAQCQTDASCNHPQLVCSGASGGFGLCRPSWMRGTFADNSSVALTDNGVTERRVIVRGLATVDTDVAIAVKLTHAAPRQIRLTLVNPAGTEVEVFRGSASSASPLVLNQPVRGFSGDESVNGEWTLRGFDASAGQSGILEGWQLTVTSRYD